MGKSSFEFKIIDNSDEFKKLLSEAQDKILEAWGIETEKNAKIELGKSPVRQDTGLLRNSITYAISGEAPKITSYRSESVNKKGEPVNPVKTGSYSGSAPMGMPWKKYVYIGTNVEYAEWVHNGTRRMAPNRFIKNAVENNKSKLERIAKAGLEGRL